MAMGRTIRWGRMGWGLHARCRGALGPVLIEGPESAVAALLDELAGQR